MKNFYKYLFAVIILPNMANSAATILQPQQDTKASATKIAATTQDIKAESEKEKKATFNQDVKAESTTVKIAATKTDSAQAVPTTPIVGTEVSADKKTVASTTTVPSTSAVTSPTAGTITPPVTQSTVTATTPPTSSTLTTSSTATPAQPITTTPAQTETKTTTTTPTIIPTTTVTPSETTSKPSVITTPVVHEELPIAPTPISDIHFETPESAPILPTDTIKTGLDITLEEPQEEGIKIERLEEIKEPEVPTESLTKKIKKAAETTDEEKIILECKPIKINGKKAEQIIKEEDTDITLSVEPEEEETVSESDEDELSLAKEQQKHLKQAKGVHHADLEVEELDLEDKINAQEEQKEEAFDAAIETL